MKIGILTQAINNNYGGILQNYALQTILERMGHEVITLNWDTYYCEHAHEPRLLRCWQSAKTFITRNILHKTRNYKHEQRQLFYQLSTNNQDFCTKYIHLSEWLWGKEQFLKFTIEKQLDVLIVGSDQTWRPQYNKNGMLYRMFLDFAEGLSIKRVAFSASFGVNDWEYDNKQTEICSHLIKYFNAVSVREESGVLLCKQNLKYGNVEWTLDPTLLLNQDDYRFLLEKENVRPSKGKILTYILDYSPAIQRLIFDVAEKKQLQIVDFSPKYCNLGTTTKDSIQDYISPSVLDWLQAFNDAEYVICDSFHGTVFSLIFKKRFVTIGNTNRGYDRFISLLKQFNLEDRIISDLSADIIPLIDNAIDWKMVYEKLKIRKDKSIDFIRNALS